MDRLTAIEVFVAVAERGSLTAAAAQQDMSRAMVTRYLAELERWLGVRVLHRTTRRVTLTAAGEQALERFRRMLEIGSELHERLAIDDPEPRGHIRIATSLSFGQSHLAPAVARYVGRHRQVQVDLLLQDRTVNLVEERVDLAVRVTRRIDEGLIARRLAPCHSLLCAAPGYLRTHGTPQTLEALAAHNCLTHAYAGRHAWTFLEDGAPFPVAVSGNVSANEATVLLQLVRAEAGIAMLPTYLVAPLVRSGELVAVLPDCRIEPMDIHGVYVSRRQMPRVVRSFLDYLADSFGDPPYWDRPQAR